MGFNKWKNVVQTEKDLKEIFPKKNWNKLHLQIIWYGREYCKARDCYGITLKFVKAVIQIEKNQLKQKKHNLKMKVIGIQTYHCRCNLKNLF